MWSVWDMNTVLLIPLMINKPSDYFCIIYFHFYNYGLCVKLRVSIFYFDSTGFMCGTTVLDKDGISAAMVCAEMATWLAERNITITQQLEHIYQK